MDGCLRQAEVRPTVYTGLMEMQVLPKVKALRYILPLREGGSLPILAEADNGKKYVVKMRGAGQGVLSLVAEILSGEIARSLGLHVPELVLIDLDAAFGRNEPDAEIQDLFKKSVGWNVGMEFVPEATIFDAAAGDKATAEEASRTVWLDAFTMNVDRTPKNANLLRQKNCMWLIDHGASLYFHHDWPHASDKVGSKFTKSGEHILLRWATENDDAAQFAHEKLTVDELSRIVGLVPDEYLVSEAGEATVQERRAAYLDFFTARLDQSKSFVEEIARVRAEVL
ncbi:HipA family kinase [Granulicella paludicola]|uniref:HipA family kinase n=1 Tax=Granulicella paludicola TaxID=474951 RepID=UPI0021E09E49|nr:HipA family kinase [Granulicella paludicola]